MRSGPAGDTDEKGSKERPATSSPDNIDSPVNSSESSGKDGGRKSPSSASIDSNSSASDKESKDKISLEREACADKKKDQERPESPVDSSNESSSEDAENANDGDVEDENVNDDDSSSSSSSGVPSPAPSDSASQLVNGIDTGQTSEETPSPRAITPQEIERVPSPQSSIPPVLPVESNLTTHPAVSGVPPPELVPVAPLGVPQGILGNQPLPLSVPRELSPHSQRTSTPPVPPTLSRSYTPPVAPPPGVVVPPIGIKSEVGLENRAPETRRTPTPPGVPPPSSLSAPIGTVPTTQPLLASAPGALGVHHHPPPGALYGQPLPPNMQHLPPGIPPPHHYPPPPHELPALVKIKEEPLSPTGGMDHRQVMEHRPPGADHHPGLDHRPGMDHRPGLDHRGPHPSMDHRAPLEHRPRSPGSVLMGGPSPSHPMRPRSPLQRSRTPPPMMPSGAMVGDIARPRSRSPLRDSDSESEPCRTPSPQPEAISCNEECYKSKNAIFIKHWNRGRNTCSRCDFEFRPYSSSKLAIKREERNRRSASQMSTAQPLSSSSSHHSSSGTHPPPNASSTPVSSSAHLPPSSSLQASSSSSSSTSASASHGAQPPPRPHSQQSHPQPSRTPVKEDRREERRDDDRRTKSTTPPAHSSADAQITSSFLSGQPGLYAGPEPRLNPYGVAPHDPTPALRQLSEYARPHALGQDPARSLGYAMSPQVDPMMHYRIASMYPPGSRERLELELERDKRERDARERELRERELRDMELREKMKQELEMKPPGFDRLPPPGTNPLDPQWIEMQRRYASLGHGPPGAGGHHPSGHIPGVYPPASLANDLVARERERLERLAADRMSAERIHAERLAIANADPMMRLQMANNAAVAAAAAQAHMHTHAHSHTHLHVHQQEMMQQHLANLSQMHSRSSSGADQLAAAASAMGPHIHPSHLQHGHTLLPPGASREQELAYHSLLARSPYGDPLLAHQLSAQAAHHEALQRLAMERDRLGGGPPPHMPQ